MSVMSMEESQEEEHSNVFFQVGDFSVSTNLSELMITDQMMLSTICYAASFGLSWLFCL